MVDEKATQVKFESDEQRRLFKEAIAKAGKTGQEVWQAAVRAMIVLGKTSEDFIMAAKTTEYDIKYLKRELAKVRPENEQLKAELAAVYAKVGADFEKVRFIDETKTHLITNEMPPECDNCLHCDVTDGECSKPGECEFTFLA